jgi:hypothetical protein
MANPRTVADYQAAMLHAIGNSQPATGITTLEILNDAVRELFTFSEWSWRRRPPATLNLVASQSYVSLPADFGELETVHWTTSPLVAVNKVGLDDIARLRGGVITDSYARYVAVSWPSQTTSSVRPAQARLEIWPTPTATAAAAIRIVYKAGAIDLVNAGDVPNIPKEYESALLMLARGKLKFHELDGDAVEYQAGLAALQKLQEYDGLQERDAGAITGGAVADLACGQGTWRPFSTNSVPNHVNLS